MADTFTLNVDVASLQAVEKTLADIGAQCQEEGAKLAAKPGEATDWSGGTANTLKTAMSSLAADMQQAHPHFADAVTAVATFRAAVQHAQESLPSLNKSWADSVSTYNAAVAKADKAYNDAKAGTPPQVWKADDGGAGTTRSSATSSAAADCAMAQRWIGASWTYLHTDLITKARACGTALAGAVSRAVPPQVVKAYLDGHPVSFVIDPSAYLMGASPFPSSVNKVTRELIAKGVLPPECAGMTAVQLTAYLTAHPDIARNLAQNSPVATGTTPNSPESQLAMLLLGWDPNATGAAAEAQRVKARAMFGTLTPQDQALLAVLFPSQVGNLSGAPFPARAAGNRVSIIVANDDTKKKIAELQAKLAGMTGQGMPTGGRGGGGATMLYAARLKLENEIKALQAQQGTYQGVVDHPDRQVVLFDAASGKFAEMSGEIGPTTKNVSVIVPGTGTNMGNIGGNVTKYDGFADKSGGSLVTITWMGGELPQSLITDAPRASYSNKLAPSFAEFSHDVRQEINSSTAADNNVQLTLAGHSYGGAVVGKAEVYGSDADRELYIEAAGMGNDVSSPKDEHPTNPNVKRYSMTAPGDPIGDIQGLDVGGLGLGPDPDTWPGTTRLETGNYADGSQVKGFGAHGGVFKQGSDSWQQMYEVMTGGTVTTYGANEPKQIYIAGGGGYGMWVDNPDYKPAQKVDIP